MLFFCMMCMALGVVFFLSLLRGGVVTISSASLFLLGIFVRISGSSSRMSAGISGSCSENFVQIPLTCVQSIFSLFLIPRCTAEQGQDRFHELPLSARLSSSSRFLFFLSISCQQSPCLLLFGTSPCLCPPLDQFREFPFCVCMDEGYCPERS